MHLRDGGVCNVILGFPQRDGKTNKIYVFNDLRFGLILEYGITLFYTWCYRDNNGIYIYKTM